MLALKDQQQKAELAALTPASSGHGRLLRKPTKMNGSSASSSKPAAGGSWQTVLPALLEFLSTPSWEDGSFRETGKLTIFTEYGKWKATVADPAGGRVAFVTADDPDSLLMVVDEGLTQDSLDWRPQKPYQANGGRR